MTPYQREKLRHIEAEQIRLFEQFMADESSRARIIKLLIVLKYQWDEIVAPYQPQPLADVAKLDGRRRKKPRDLDAYLNRARYFQPGRG